MPAPKRPLSPPPVHSIPASDETPPSATPLAAPPPLLLKHEPDVEDREATAQELRDGVDWSFFLHRRVISPSLLFAADFDGRVGGGRSSDEGEEEEEDDEEAEKPE